MRSCRLLVVLLVCIYVNSFRIEPLRSQEPSNNASAVYPLDCVIVGDDDVIVVDRNLPGLWRRRGDELQILVKGSKRFREPLNAARCVAVDKSGKIVVGDSSTRDIYRLDDSNQLQPLTGGKIGIPMDIAVRADGSFMVADAESRTLLRVSSDGKDIRQIAKVNPRGVFVDSSDKVWVVSQDPQQLQVVDDEGKSTAIVNKRIFEFPHQVVVDSQGDAYVSDGYKRAIWKISKNGAAPTIAFSGLPLENPVGLTLVKDQVVITDPRARQVFRLVDGKCEPWFEITAKPAK